MAQIKSIAELRKELELKQNEQNAAVKAEKDTFALASVKGSVYEASDNSGPTGPPVLPSKIPLTGEDEPSKSERIDSMIVKEVAKQLAERLSDGDKARLEGWAGVREAMTGPGKMPRAIIEGLIAGTLTYIFCEVGHFFLKKHIKEQKKVKLKLKKKSLNGKLQTLSPRPLKSQGPHQWS